MGEKGVTKRFSKLFNTGVVFAIFTLLFWVVAFVSPFWVVSWPRVHSKFKRTGLWETCLFSYWRADDIKMKSHYGCWWVFHPENYDIQDWLMPPWFRLCQALATFTLIGVLVFVIVLLVVCLGAAATDAVEYHQDLQKQRRHTKLVKISTWAFAIISLFASATCIIFVGYFKDPLWMPRPKHNYLSWSYGLAVIGCLCSFIATYFLFRESKRRDRETFSGEKMTFELAAPSKSGGQADLPQRPF